MSNQKFITMLETLIATLEQSPQTNLEMSTWFKKYDRYKCGYAACVCGEQAIQRNFDVFPMYILPVQDVGMNNYAGYIAMHLDMACEEATSNISLAESIYAGGLNERRIAARAFFTAEQVAEFKHLTEVNPTPADAIEYIKAVIQRINELND